MKSDEPPTPPRLVAVPPPADRHTGDAPADNVLPLPVASTPTAEAEANPDAAHAPSSGLCQGCVYAPSLWLQEQCTPGDRCVRAHSGRQIDRFFRLNPGEAEHFLRDIFWERRAIAARYAPMDSISTLAHDPDEVVRRVVAGRLPPELIGQFVHDADREVRLTVAQKIPENELIRLVNDPDYLVRVIVARRLPHSKLKRMVNDPEREVRKVVAEHLPPFVLELIADDPEAEIRAIVARRALPELAAKLLHDPEWWVRVRAVENAPLAALPPLLADPEPDVREAVSQRLNETDTDPENDVP